MAASSRPSNSEKLEFCKKLVNFLKKRYKTPVPKQEEPVLQTMLLAVCLENNTLEQALAALKHLETDFHDLNEVRVSSIAELEIALKDQSDAEHRAHQLRNILQYVFERNFSFEFESFRKKNVEQATKILNKIRNLSGFCKSYVMQHTLGSHIVPLDRQMTGALIWLGVLEKGTSTDAATEAIKSCIRKSDAAEFCHFLRYLGNEEKLKPYFHKAASTHSGEAFTLHDALHRLTDLIESSKRAPKVVERKKLVKKPTVKTAKPRRPAASAETHKKVAKKATPTKKVTLKRTVKKKYNSRRHVESDGLEQPRSFAEFMNAGEYCPHGLVSFMNRYDSYRGRHDEIRRSVSFTKTSLGLPRLYRLECASRSNWSRLLPT